MNLETSVETILVLEREGKQRLADAERQVRAARERAREDAERLRRETEEVIREERERLSAEQNEKTGKDVRSILENSRKEERRLRALAGRNRERALGLIRQWLRER